VQKALIDLIQLVIYVRKNLIYYLC